MWFLLLVLIAGICFVTWATKVSAQIETIEEGKPSPYGGLIIGDESSEKITRDLQKFPILEERLRNLEEQLATQKESNANLSEQNVNLTQQMEVVKQLLDIEKKKTQLEHERAQFYIEQGIAKDAINQQQNVLIDRLTKEAEKKTFWRSFAIGEILLFLGLIGGALL